MPQNSIVLVVDDEPIGLEVVKALLYDSAYDLHFASNGREALAKTETLRPDLILLDVLMPGMSGYDVCRTIRDTPHLADIPIILLTALNDRDAKIRGIQSGADDFISKPFDRLELSVRVRTILRLNRYRRINSERARFEWVVASAEDGYLLLNSADQITYANSAARRWLDLPMDEDAPLDNFLTVARKRFQCQPDGAWTDWPTVGTGARQLVRAQNKSADSFWLSVDVTADESGGDSYLVRLSDMTQEINQRKLQWSFHSQIQHKFRHPLTALTGHLELLHDDPDGQFDHPQLIENAYRASTHLSREILAVLDYLTRTSDNGGEQKGSCAVEELIDIAERLEAQLPQIYLRLRSTIHNPRDYKLPIDCRQFETILWELFENAIKFHPENSPAIAVTFERQHDKLLMRVEDNGHSLAPEQLKQVWTPYYQAERYYTGQVPGMGLGLSMIAATVWGVGGTCAAYNRTDEEGLVIQLTFPLTSTQQPAAIFAMAD
jgi:DNA-binding response OmpR family regulator